MNNYVSQHDDNKSVELVGECAYDQNHDKPKWVVEMPLKWPRDEFNSLSGEGFYILTRTQEHALRLELTVRMTIKSLNEDMPQYINY